MGERATTGGRREILIRDLTEPNAPHSSPWYHDAHELLVSNDAVTIMR